MAQVQTLDLALVYRRTGARPVDPKHVARLADSMKVIGLKEPIEVRACQKVRNGAPADAFEIVTGQHRFEAARSLGWKEIDAFVSDTAPDMQRLWEIDENLLHNSGSPAQRAQWHGEREAIMVRMGLAASPGKGGDRRSIAKTANGPRYTKQAASALGKSERSVQVHLARAKKITPEVLAAVTGTEHDTGVTLDVLAATPKAQQAKKLESIKAERAAPKPAPTDPPVSLSERRIQPLLAEWAKLNPADQALFLERIGATLQQRDVA